MAKPLPVRYVLTDPAPPTWWKNNRHVVLLVVGLFVGGWLVDGHGDTSEPAADHPKPAHSAPAAAGGS